MSDGDKITCCPPNAWPAFIPEKDYEKQIKGSLSELSIPNPPEKDPENKQNYTEKMRVYRTGNKDSKTVILYVVDVFGLDGSRCKGLSDTLASETGCEVICPDILCGGICDNPFDTDNLMKFIAPFGFKQTIEARLGALFNDTENAYNMKSRKIITVAFCYGTYVAANLCTKEYKTANPDISIVANCAFHPSNRLAPVYGQDEWALADDAQEGIPYFMLATDDDPAAYHPKGYKNDATEKDGSAEKDSGKLEGIWAGKNGGKIEVHPPMKGMNHGYMARGDVSKEEVKKAVKKSIEMMLGFLKKNEVC